MRERVFVPGIRRKESGNGVFFTESTFLLRVSWPPVSSQVSSSHPRSEPAVQFTTLRFDCDVTFSRLLILQSQFIFKTLFLVTVSTTNILASGVVMVKI